MSDAEPQPPEPPRADGGGYELDVDVRTFLPDGTQLADPAPAPTRAPASDLAELEAIELELAAVDEALTRLDDGSYGRCRACGDLIADARLAAEPTASTCAAHG